MRYSILLLICSLTTHFSLGQNSQDTLLSKRTLDSLHREIADLKARNNDLYWEKRTKSKGVKVDTTYLSPEIAVFQYYSVEGKLVLNETAKLNNRKQWIAGLQRYFDDSGREVYIQHWIMMEDDRFDARLQKEERMKYDSLGRILLHVTYYATSNRRTQRVNYWYDKGGKQYQQVSTNKGYSFWD